MNGASKPVEFESPLKGMKWEQMSLPQRVQAMMSKGKDAQRFQTMAQKATSNLAKAADDTALENPNTQDRRKPKAIQLNGRQYNIDYLMNTLGLRKDKQREKENDPMSVYDSELRVGLANNQMVHNHTREGRGFKHGAEVPRETSNSGEAHSLDYAVRNVHGMKRHMAATNIGKRLPGKKSGPELDKAAALVGYLLAGFLKSAEDHLPDFEKQPELLIPFLEGFAKQAGLSDRLLAAISSISSAGSGGAGYETPHALQQMITRKATPSKGMNPKLVPPGGPTITSPRRNVMAQRAAGNVAMGQ